MYDIVIKNPTIIDGAKNKRYQSDVGISGGKIKKIGEIKPLKAKKIINGNNLYLAPGFIDLNNHSDTYLALFTNPDLESMIMQGVTTILGGNCGSSLAPLASADMIKSVQKWADITEINLNWLTFKEFLKEAEKRKPAVNFASLVGHSTLRRGILGDEFRPLKRKELDIIKRLLEVALKEGAFGLSTGLAYSHAKIASLKEIIELVKIVKENKGIYTSHIMGEAEELLPAIKETIKVAKQTGASVEISHLKAMGRKFWFNMDEALSLIEKAYSPPSGKAKGRTNINFDIYPYTVTGSVLYILLPDWVAEGGKEMLLKKLKNKLIRKKVIKEMQEKKDYEYDKITINGRSITEIAQVENISVEEAIINMLIVSDGRVIAFLDTLNEDNVETGIVHPLSFIVSDGAGYSINHYRKKRELVHPRCFGAFPRFLRKYVREKQLLTWEEAIYKITNGPAQKLGIKDRGRIKKNCWADLVLFDPQKITDRATFKNPFQYPEGIEYVLVNGNIAVEKGKYTKTRAGKVLKKK